MTGVTTGMGASTATVGVNPTPIGGVDCIAAGCCTAHSPVADSFRVGLVELPVTGARDAEGAGTGLPGIIATPTRGADDETVIGCLERACSAAKASLAVSATALAGTEVAASFVPWGPSIFCVAGVEELVGCCTAVAIVLAVEGAANAPRLFPLASFAGTAATGHPPLCLINVSLKSEDSPLRAADGNPRRRPTLVSVGAWIASATPAAWELWIKCGTPRTQEECT